MQNEQTLTGCPEFTARAHATRGLVAAKSAADRSHIRHHGYASSSCRASTRPPRALRASLAQEVLREIRSLFRRISEIRSRELDRRGISIDPLREIALPREERESALAGCIEDTQNLYTSRPGTTLIDSELFVRGWDAGSAWSHRNLRTEPLA